VTEAPVIGTVAPSVVTAAAITTPPTSAPTGAPVGTGALTPTPDPLVSLIQDNLFGDTTAITVLGSPQNQALEWLRGNANLVSYDEATQLQRFALATFYYSTNGDSWEDETIRSTWLTDDPECTWAGSDAGQCTGSVYSSLTLDFIAERHWTTDRP
jgi:hypothetical protein